MGSRGSFEDVDIGNFTFKQGGRHYKTIGVLSDDPNVKIIVQDSSNVKAPEYSHTESRVYAVVKDGALKHLAFYDENHKQAVSIDLLHAHQGVQPHRHVYMNHKPNAPGMSPTKEEMELIRKIKREFRLR